MKRSYLIFVFLMLLQLNVFAQLEFSDSYIDIKMSKGQITNSFRSTLNSSILDSIITEYITSENIPGATGLIISKEGDIKWSGNYGYRNLEYQLPVEDSTLFLMASISKTFLATAIMQLWEIGLIDLNRNINDYLPLGFTVVNPHFPNDTITVKMLMTHTSSLADNWNILWELYSCGDYPASVDNFLINYFTPGGTYYNINNFTWFHPGLHWNYANAGSCLLALIIKNITGKNVDEYTRDSILIPLAMNSSSWFLQGMDTNKIATPYIDNPPQAICHTGMAYWPICQLRTNKFELANFLSIYLRDGVYNNYRILDSTTISLMLTDQLGYPTDWGTRQGLIFFSDTTTFKTVWGHTGGWLGCETVMYFNPLEDWGFVFFINKGEAGNYSPGFFPTVKFIANFAHLLGNVYAMTPVVDKSYARKGIDSVLFSTRFSNIYNHQFAAYLIYNDLNGSQIDSLVLFDDGLHGDSLSNDGIYGGYIPPQPEEKFFKLSISTFDFQTNKYFVTEDISRFTTAGNVSLDSLAFINVDSNYTIQPFVHNEGENATIMNAEIRLLCNDPWVVSIYPDKVSLPDIAPGASIGTLSLFTVEYENLQFPGYFNFKVEMTSDGWTYWIDSMTVIVTDVSEDITTPLAFSLKQNYPNPFNPVTTIKYTIPGISKVSLILFNLLGEEVATLVNEEKVAGNYTVELNAASLPSGVYLYRIQAGEFVETKKMVLLK